MFINILGLYGKFHAENMIFTTLVKTEQKINGRGVFPRTEPNVGND